jgi:hypothetical protein
MGFQEQPICGLHQKEEASIVSLSCRFLVSLLALRKRRWQRPHPQGTRICTYYLSLVVNKAGKCIWARELTPLADEASNFEGEVREHLAI